MNLFPESSLSAITATRRAMRAHAVHRFLVPACLTVLAAGPASAAESYDGCTGFIDAIPATLASQGTWCLRHDVSTAIATGVAITIANNNITIDCNDFKVGGLGAGIGTATDGIATSGERVNATVRNCRIRGFRSGIHLQGDSALAEGNTLDGNTTDGIRVTGDNAIVRDNQLHDTGGAPAAHANGIVVQGLWTQVLDNQLQGVAGPSDPLAGTSTAIRIGKIGIVQGNRISEVPHVYAAILMQDDSIARDNIVSQPDENLDGSWGMACDNPDSNVVLDNQFFAFNGFPAYGDPPFYRCADSGGNVNYGNPS